MLNVQNLTQRATQRYTSQTALGCNNSKFLVGSTFPELLEQEVFVIMMWMSCSLSCQNSTATLNSRQFESICVKYFDGLTRMFQCIQTSERSCYSRVSRMFLAANYRKFSIEDIISCCLPPAGASLALRLQEGINYRGGKQYFFLLGLINFVHNLTLG